MTSSRRATLLKCAGVGGAVLGMALAMVATAADSGPAATAPKSGCSATPHVSSKWGSGPTGGEVITVTVANTSATPSTQWTVGYTLATGQRIVSTWNATVRISGTTATAVNDSYNGKLAPGASTTFGMELAGTGLVSGFTCANSPVGQSPSGPTGSASPPGTGRTVTVTTADNRTTVNLQVGDMLVVYLPAMYEPPTVAQQAGVLSQIDVTGGYPTNGPLVARYLAAAQGQADISTLTDSACNHAPSPCPSPQIAWTLHVDVGSASPSGSATPPGNGHTVTVTTADNRTSISLRVGDMLVVSLPAMYEPPTVAQAGALTQLDVNGGYPTGQPLVARYLAAAQGQADISTLTDSTCNHAPTPCPSPQVPWTIHVTVGA